MSPKVAVLALHGAAAFTVQLRWPRRLRGWQCVLTTAPD